MGKGDLDYDLYLKHLNEAGYGGPLVMHGLAEEEVEGSLAFLRRKLAEITSCSSKKTTGSTEGLPPFA